MSYISNIPFYNKSLNKYNDVVLFPEKLAKANEMLRKVGLPHQIKRTVKNSAKKHR
jgi:hypothetical protein